MRPTGDGAGLSRLPAAGRCATGLVDVARLRVLLRPWGCDQSWRLAPTPQQGASSRTWTVRIAGTPRYVAKLIFDGRPYTEPGLRVAAELARRGVRTGPPVPTTAGELCRELLPAGADRRSTLALLRFEPGDPLNSDAPDAATVAGNLLGRVHAALAPLPATAVPGRLAEWCVDRATTFGSECLTAAELVRGLCTAGTLRCSVVYGDPSPEVLTAGHTAALIDWGTPSWGPVLHDVAVWTQRFHATSTQPARQRQFLAAYRRHASLSPAERQHLPAVVNLLNRLQLFGPDVGPAE